MKLLCLDGGGVRGVLQARVLERLEEQQPFLTRVDRFAGSSIGVVSAMWLATDRPVTELVSVFRKAAPFVFSGGGFLERHAQLALRTTLQHYLGKLRLRDLKRPVLAGAVGRDGPRFFDPLAASDQDELVIDVVLAATAAPPALPPHKGLVDGGALANDPGKLAFTWALNGGHEVAALLSIGTGRAIQPEQGGFLKALLHAASSGQQASVEVELLRALSDRYYRVQPVLDRPIALDEVRAVDELVRAADRWDLSGAASWVRRRFA